jgi:hypothetical protein
MSDALVPLMSDALAPFRKLAAGIPDNWPADAVLTIEPDDEGRPLMFLCYVPAGWAPGWPTVADWRALEQVEVEYPFDDRLRDYDDQVVE